MTNTVGCDALDKDAVMSMLFMNPQALSGTLVLMFAMFIVMIQAT